MMSVGITYNIWTMEELLTFHTQKHQHIKESDFSETHTLHERPSNTTNIQQSGITKTNRSHQINEIYKMNTQLSNKKTK